MKPRPESADVAAEHPGAARRYLLAVERAFERLLEMPEFCEYAIKVGFWKWVGLKPIVAARKRWHRIDEKLSYFETKLRLEAWNMDLRVVVYRRSHIARARTSSSIYSPPMMGHYEYSARLDGWRGNAAPSHAALAELARDDFLGVKTRSE